MSERPDIEVRNLRFKFDESIPRHWNGGSESGTAFFDSQSLLFPAGERFFVRSVVALLPKIRDPELLRKARAFCGQEGMHTREHVHYNRRLQALGYPAARLERWVANFLRLVWWTTLPRWRLAITCAIEHFTAIGAARALGSQGLDAAEPRMRAFWRWHAAEELEHKSIPFDIYQAVGGNYVERIAIMFMTTLTFRAFLFFHLACFLWVDGVLFTRRAFSELGRTLRALDSAGTFWRDYALYYKPGFHPSQLSDRQKLEHFHNELLSSPHYAAAR